jgi:hypothetical protein
VESPGGTPHSVRMGGIGSHGWNPEAGRRTGSHGWNRLAWVESGGGTPHRFAWVEFPLPYFCRIVRFLLFSADQVRRKWQESDNLPIT